jgi:hypothetical protein
MKMAILVMGVVTMVRTQLQLDRRTYEALRARAHKERKSMSAVAREVLGTCLDSGAPTSDADIKRFRFIGAGDSGLTDVSIRHDDYLAEDFR